MNGIIWHSRIIYVHIRTHKGAVLCIYLFICFWSAFPVGAQAVEHLHDQHVCLWAYCVLVMWSSQYRWGFMCCHTVISDPANIEKCQNPETFEQEYGHAVANDLLYFKFNAVQCCMWTLIFPLRLKVTRERFQDCLLIFKSPSCWGQASWIVFLTLPLTRSMCVCMHSSLRTSV